MAKNSLKIFLPLAIAATVIAGLIGWQHWKGSDSDANVASGNGRIEAVEIDIAARSGGRVSDILIEEGDMVQSGQVVAVMDTAVLNAQRQEASAQLERAIIAVETSESLVTQRIAEKAAAEALVAQRLAEKDAAEKRLNRSEQLSRQNAIAEQTLDDHRATVQSSLAAVNAARAQVAAAEAAIGTARSQVVSAKTAVVAARASVERIDADISDSFLKSPRDGRVQYLISQPGEVVGSGGRILNMADLSDVYMGFFLPTAAAGVIELNSEARIILDAAPDYVIPATITYVADVAQFTPKTVETASERQKLMFRVKATIPQDLLKKHLQQIKTGLPGMAYVRLDPSQPWPEALTIKLPPKPISLTETQ